MSGGVGCRLKAAAVFLLLCVILSLALAGLASGKAEARASLRGYATAGPNTWEFQGFNVTGTAARFIVDHGGWNVSRTFGNVGIGDGSVRALNMSSNLNDINYTDRNFMAGDVTMAPWDPSQIRDFSMPKESIPEYNATTKNVTSDINGGLATKGERETNKTSEVSVAQIGGNMALRDPYHSILVGRPVGDLLYEHPHAISANMYARLVGLGMPGGARVNVGMRAIGYGY